ncbi:hypothetical protein CMU19_04380 [Elizabethkingia anophelis]|nr:hypothetical protein [Elizabethkingia anophelis]
MKKLISKILGFLGWNVFLLWLHKEAFQLQPVLLIATIIIHIAMLIYFPYKEFFNSNTNNNEQ